MCKAKKTPNRLIHEKSPYLLQHAYNPVYWYPWSKDAFDRAREEDKPVFLSIGYSTCHWCHRLSEESFEDEEVAEYLNEHFICIKVDREERPDIDQIYMSVCVALNGSGGWPLSIFMTSEQKPFYAGTYFPRYRRYDHPGFMDVLRSISVQWQKGRIRLSQAGEEISKAVAEERMKGNDIGELPSVSSAAAEQVYYTAVHKAYDSMKSSYDEVNGGFGAAPKFPSPHNLLFLLRLYHLEGEEKALKMTKKTLLQMYRGGIFDHIGYGFSRYSTDPFWLAPHFEKMLYDNVLLCMAYLEAWAITGEDWLKDVAVKVMQYLMREMKSPDGGFYCAQDADSEGEEGKFYTFSKSELIDLLGEKAGQEFCTCFGVTKEGNFEGKNILNLLSNCNCINNCESNISLDDEILKKVYLYRQNRYELGKDDKILTSWNGLAMAAFAMAGRMTGNSEYLKTAANIYVFLNTNMKTEQGRFFISWREGEAGGQGMLDDYAFYIWGCLELYESTFDVCYLKDAIETMEKTITFFQAEGGGFYLNPSDGEKLLFRPVEQYDGAIPSGNSVIAYCLAQLSSYTGRKYWGDYAKSQLDFYQQKLNAQPQAYTFALTAAQKEVLPTGTVVCILQDKRNLTAVVQHLGRHYHPEVVCIGMTESNAAELKRLAPFLNEYQMLKNKETFYICYGQKCLPPVHTANECIHMLDRLRMDIRT